MSAPKSQGEWIEALGEAIEFAKVIERQIEPGMGPPIPDNLGIEFSGPSILDFQSYLAMSKAVLGALKDKMECDRIFGGRKWQRSKGGVLWPVKSNDANETDDEFEQRLWV